MSGLGRNGILAVTVLAAACQPLPHPFADDRPPAALLRVRDVVSVSIAPVDGEPTATAEKLAAAMASALLQREVPASDLTTSLGSYQLNGRIEQSRPQKGGTVVVTAHWRLADSKGREVGEKTAHFEAPGRAWEAADVEPVAALAGLSADGLLPLLIEEAPAATEGAGRIRIAVGTVSGAPGDGGKALVTAAAAVLKGRDLAIVEAGQPADLLLDGEVSVTPVKPDKQHVKIVWRMRRPDGGEIGTVGQENDMPKGALDGAWGDVAYIVATAAGDGLMQLIARGAPGPKS